MDRKEKTLRAISAEENTDIISFFRRLVSLRSDLWTELSIKIRAKSCENKKKKNENGRSSVKRRNSDVNGGAKNSNLYDEAKKRNLSENAQNTIGSTRFTQRRKKKKSNELARRVRIIDEDFSRRRLLPSKTFPSKKWRPPGCEWSP